MSTYKLNVTLPKLYGVSSTGKTKEWSIRVVDNACLGYASIITRHGYVGGKIQESEKKIYAGKNIGKSNETTMLEQALLEANSDYSKKKDQKYSEVIGQAIDLELPMLAHEYSKRSHNIKFPCYAQPKLNGIRNLAKLVDETTVRHSSRGGKIFNTLSHISEEIKKRSMLEPGEIFDGELFSPHLTFQEICAAVKRESEVNPDTLLLEYHVYDFADPTLKFSERLAKLSEKITDDHIIKLVETRLIESEEDLILYHKTNVDRGFEGTMIRNMDGAYVFKNRSSDLQKYKDFLEAEFEIVGGKEGSGKSEGQCVFSCITENGGAFDVRCVGSNEVREEQLINLESYIGKMLTVKYQTLSDDGIPIFPVGITLRDYE